MEIKSPFVVPPWAETLNITTRVVENPNEARKSHDKLLREIGIHIYIDSLGVENRIGVAAFYHKIGDVRQAYLGTKQNSIVYAGELYSIIMALEIIQDSKWICPAYIFIDNQIVVDAITKPIAREAQYLIRELH
jgi:hypothetical protein